MTSKDTLISKHNRTQWAAPLTAAVFILVVLFRLATPAGAAPVDPKDGDAGVQPGIEVIDPGVLHGIAVTYDVSLVCHDEYEGGVAVAITNHSQDPQFVTGLAATQPLTSSSSEDFAVTVDSVSTVRYVLGPWDTGSYVGMTLRHAGNAPTNHDVKINCGPPVPSAHAFTTCRWPGGRDIWVELGNTGTGDAEFVVSYLLSGDDQVIPSQHTVAPGDSETVNIPVNYNGTWFVDVREQMTNEHLIDEKLTIDCEPIDDTVESPSAPEGKDENDPGVNSITPVSGEESNPESQVEDSSPTVTEIPGEQDTSSGPAELDLETVADTPSQSAADNNMAVMGLTAAGAAAAAVAAVAVRKRR